MWLAASAARAAEPVPNFSREVRPILSDHCFACHGPDEAQRMADLRLDSAEGLARVVGGDAAGGELLARIESSSEDEMMPPPEFHKPLAAEQKQTLRRWLAAGGEFEQHWAFVPPAIPPQPVPDDVPGLVPIDAWIEYRARQAGLKLNGPADRRTLLRRVCLDLTGLPPTRQQIDSFLRDDSPEAYERLVDQLLASPHFGEHQGRYWLDLVRYADTHGLHLDNYREMWPYRDWVIAAFNSNMPFDQFIVEQLAGDLLPDATPAQRIASGFNRLNVTTNEGGSIYEEVFARNVIDRTDAFGTIFLGLTTGCAVCHDHKFDPITQRDYYSMFAFFNSLDGRAMDGNAKDPAPVITVTTADLQRQLDETDEALRLVGQQMRSPMETLDDAQRSWEQSLVEAAASGAGNAEPPARQHVALIPTEVTSEAGVKMQLSDDGSFKVVGEAAAKDNTIVLAELPAGGQWQTLVLEALVDTPEQRVGLSGNGNVVLSEVVVEQRPLDSQAAWTPLPIPQAAADVEQADGAFGVSYAIDGKLVGNQGWAAAGHQKPGGRQAWFSMPALAEISQPTELRIQLKYQSQYAQHQFRQVRLSLSDAPLAEVTNQELVASPFRLAGPIRLDDPATGYAALPADDLKQWPGQPELAAYGGVAAWEPGSEALPVAVNTLPAISNAASVSWIHQTIASPAPQDVQLLFGCDDGHVVFLNGQEVGRLEGERPLQALQRQYELKLQKGNNEIVVQVVNHQADSRWTYALVGSAVQVPVSLAALVRLPAAEREEPLKEALRLYYRRQVCQHADWLALEQHETKLQEGREQLLKQRPTTLVWKELAEPRTAHLLIRGQYDAPGDAVPRATPGFLPDFPADAPLNRLGLAQWLTMPEHPLTSRVVVNRFWQQLFGTGLVKTSEDFGSQGEPPVHPELLDWLAADFQMHAWDVKRFMKQLVLTQAYQRSSAVTPSMLKIDPLNRLLARGPRFRLDAEVLRDQALALSGLLVDKQGGPSVKPPQPDGLWAAVGYSGSNTVRFTEDSGEKQLRRSVYTFWKRTAAPPQMSTFDAPSRESCTARRERTNTPLQALVMLNESQYLRAARELAHRGLTESAGSSPRDQLGWLFETVTVRPPSASEADELCGLFEELTAYYQAHPELANQLAGTDEQAVEVASWTVLASTLLNLDEVVAK